MEVDKARLDCIYDQCLTSGYDSLSQEDVEWLLQIARQLQDELNFVNNEIPRLKARLSAQADQVYRR